MADEVDAPSPRMPATRPGLVHCPACDQETDFAVRIGTIGICATCGASLNIAPDGTVRRANAQDTAVLSPSELQQLTKARAAIARSDRRQR